MMFIRVGTLFSSLVFGLVLLFLFSFLYILYEMHIIMSGKYANNCATQNIIIIIVEITIYTESAADKNS